ncbi:MAG: DUF2164 domain-containing protein [Bacillota bacterium]
MNNRVKLSKEKKETMIKEIQEYFYHERNEELGELAASLVLDFVLDKLAPEIYNQGVYDSYKYMNNAVEDLLGIQTR